MLLKMVIKKHVSKKCKTNVIKNFIPTHGMKSYIIHFLPSPVCQPTLLEGVTHRYAVR